MINPTDRSGSYGKWVITIILTLLSINGIWTLFKISKELHSDIQYVVVISHSIFIIAGIAIIAGIWNQKGVKPFVIVIWGSMLLIATLGSPFSPAHFMMTFMEVGIVLSLTIIAATLLLLKYLRKESGKKP